MPIHLRIQRYLYRAFSYDYIHVLALFAAHAREQRRYRERIALWQRHH